MFQQETHEDFVVRADATLSELDQLWISKQRGTHIPARTDFTIRDLKAYLRNIVFVTVEIPNEQDSPLRITFAGDTVIQLMGQQTGKLVSEFFSPPLATRFAGAFSEVRTVRRPCRFIYRLEFSNRPFIESRTLIAPLSSDGIQISGFMAAVFFGHAAK